MRYIVAQTFLLDIISPVWVWSYKAPHAPRGTPPRPRNGKPAAFRLFKGHRP